MRVCNENVDRTRTDIENIEKGIDPGLSLIDRILELERRIAFETEEVERLQQQLKQDPFDTLVRYFIINKGVYSDNSIGKKHYAITRIQETLDKLNRVRGSDLKDYETKIDVNPELNKLKKVKREKRDTLKDELFGEFLEWLIRRFHSRFPVIWKQEVNKRR